MWLLSDTERVLTKEEWACIRIGLESLIDYIADDPDGQCGLSTTGVEVFDRLSATQKLAILADTCEAMQSPEVAAPKLTAISEGTVAALLQSFWNQLIMELDMSDDIDDEYPLLECRRSLLAAFEDEQDAECYEELPDESESDSDLWHTFFSIFESRFLADTDYEMSSLLDAPVERAEELKAIMGIDDEYFVAVAPDPTERQMHKVKQKLARLLGTPCPDDDGRFPAIYDRYTGLNVGPCTAEEIASWSKNLWVKATSLELPSWDCDYRVWQANFVDAMLAADPTEAVESPELTIQREQRRQRALDSIGSWPEF